VSEGLVSGGLVRQARDAVRRLHGAFHECGGAIYGVVVSCEGFVRACVQGPHREILATGAKRTQQVTTPAESSLCARLFAPLEKIMLDRGDLDWAIVDRLVCSARTRSGLFGSSRLYFERCAIGVSDESKARVAISGAFQ
jgi:hypothetical protein